MEAGTVAYLFKRGKTYHLKYYLDGRQKEKALRTSSYQIARELQRQFESRQAQGLANPLPTRTPLPGVLQAYVEHVRATKTAKSAQTDIYYLREAFGPCCEALKITSRRPRKVANDKPGKGKLLHPRKASAGEPVAPKNVFADRASPASTRASKAPVIEAACFEAVTTGQIAAFIDFKVREHGAAPKTANHYRSIIRRLYNWARQQHDIRLPGDINPAARVRPYKERAPQIRFLTLQQIDEQLDALRFNPRLQTMVAVLIYAGLRREELLWLTLDDVDLGRAACRHGGQGLIRVQAKTIGGLRWQPKTGVNRVVPISRTLRGYLDRYAPHPTTSPAPDDHFRGWYFPSPQGGLWDPDNFSHRHLAKANRQAGLPWSCLDFRHTFGSQLAQNGVSLFKVATLLGNSPEICRRHYAALVPEAMSAEVEFGPAPESGSHSAAG